ncbi:uncharacterized protein A4U43_C04F17570 [Asparagus officinalis]|uniref:Uncharacterized protein n=1 Tax=Asparagus officinalis TaxID=4686 RepID=A0A5P1F4B9_ASPOF|nr:uncharacterized protein A4U43_C04F17570 [Asparagus officinalis]
MSLSFSSGSGHGDGDAWFFSAGISALLHDRALQNSSACLSSPSPTESTRRPSKGPPFPPVWPGSLFESPTLCSLSSSTPSPHRAHLPLSLLVLVPLLLHYSIGRLVLARAVHGSAQEIPASPRHVHPVLLPPQPPQRLHPDPVSFSLR